MPSALTSSYSSERGGLADEVCYLCELPGPCPHPCKGKALNVGCWNGVRCRTRMTGHDPSARAQADREFYRDPSAWRRRALPLATGAGERRTAEQRDTERKVATEKY